MQVSKAFFVGVFLGAWLFFSGLIHSEDGFNWMDEFFYNRDLAERSKADEAMKIIAPEDIEVIATAYYRPSPDQKDFAKEVRMNGTCKYTKSGSVPRVGTIAADPEFFPVGTIMAIPGYGIGVVEDAGEGIKGQRIDVFLGEGKSAQRMAREWGVKRISIGVIGRS